MPDRLSPSFDSDPSEYDPETVRDELETGLTSFRRRSREDFTDSTRPPSEDPDNPVADSPFTTRITGTQRQAVERVHNNRSKKAQRADESFNAPTTVDAEKWAKSPNEFDYPGVDTVSDSNQRNRAQRLTQFAQSSGVVEDVSVESDLSVSSDGVGNPMGRASTDEFGTSSTVQVRDDVDSGDVDDPRFDFGPVLAHEVGHAIDFGSGLTFSEALEEDSNKELREQAVTVSKTVRGPFEDASDDRIDYRSGEGEGSKELVADFVAARTLQPRATERIAPELTEEFDNEFKDEFGRGFDDIV
jgi:hypothetical protein